MDRKRNTEKGESNCKAKEYKTLCIDQKWYVWNEVEGKLEEEKGERKE